MRTKPMSYFFKLTLAVAGVCSLALTSYADTDAAQSNASAATATEAVSADSETEVTPQQSRAQKRRLATISKTQTAAEGFESVEMFSAMETGDIEVTIKARSAIDSNILVKNNTDRPLSVQMPKTFSAVPVLRQFGGGGGGLGGGGLRRAFGSSRLLRLGLIGGVVAIATSDASPDN